MNVAITFASFTPSDHLKKYAERRLAKLARFLGKAKNASVIAVFTVDKKGHTADVHVTADHLNITALETTQDMYASVDAVLDKLSAQVKKHNEKLVDKRRRAGQDRQYFSVERYVVSGKGAGKKLAPEGEGTIAPLLPEEAADTLEQQGLAHIVFLHAETYTLHMLYRNPAGELCLIEMAE